MRRLLAPAALAFALAVLAACRPPEDPAARYRRFTAAARDGNAGAVWAMLSSDSQQRLQSRAEALAGGKKLEGVDLDPRGLVLGDLAATAPKVKSVRVARQAGDTAAVDVELEGGGRGQVELRREKDEWRVVLPGG